MKTSSDLFGVPDHVMRSAIEAHRQEEEYRKLLGGSLGSVSEWEKLQREMKQHDEVTRMKELATMGVIGMHPATFADSVASASLAAQAVAISDQFDKVSGLLAIDGSTAKAYAELVENEKRAAKVPADRIDPTMATVYADYVQREKDSIAETAARLGLGSGVITQELIDQINPSKEKLYADYVGQEAKAIRDAAARLGVGTSGTITSEVLERINSPASSLLAEYQRIEDSAADERKNALTAYSPKDDAKWMDIVTRPPNFGPSMADLMKEQERKHQKRHREQLVVVTRLADVAEASAQEAKSSGTLAREGVMWGRVGAIAGFAALLISAWPTISAMLFG